MKVEVVRTTDAQGGGVPEWVVVELQGTVETSAAGGLAGEPLGQLTVDGTHASLRVGPHVLHGAMVLLDRPLAVLERNGDDGGTDGTADGSVRVCAVVRRKVYFRNRPVPVSSV